MQNLLNEFSEIEYLITMIRIQCLKTFETRGNSSLILANRLDINGLSVKVTNRVQNILCVDTVLWAVMLLQFF